MKMNNSRNVSIHDCLGQCISYSRLTQTAFTPIKHSLSGVHALLVI